MFNFNLKIHTFWEMIDIWCIPIRYIIVSLLLMLVNASVYSGYLKHEDPCDNLLDLDSEYIYLNIYKL